MSSPKRWPYDAAHARDQAAELLVAIIEQLEPPVMEDRIFTIGERDARDKRALNYAQKALRYLESQGARTKPE